MSYAVSNYNIAHSMILKASQKYSGFISGLENKLNTFPVDPNVTFENTGFANLQKSEFSKDVRDFFSTVLDRTTGMHFIHDIEQRARETFLDETTRTKGGSQQYMHVVHMPDSFTGIITNSLGSLTRGKTLETGGISACDRGTVSMKDVVAYSGVSLVGKTGAIEILQSNTLNSNPVNPDRFSAPSLGAIVVKDHSLGITQRNASHMPIFLNAISPIDASKMTPFISIAIMTPRKRYDNKGHKGSLSNFLGRSSDRIFPVKSIPGVSGYSTDFTFIDVFTSTQTLVNSSVNKNATTIDSILNPETLPVKNLGYGKVIDPFQPLMSLIDISVNIAGNGYGLMASKTVTAKIKLHDRSRMRDISFFLNPAEFSFTKFYIEYGWNHPEGSPASKNIIGQYINALRDIGIFQLTKTDYTFGNDNSVDLSLTLACTGYQSMTSIPAGGGIVSNIAIFDGVIEDIISKWSALNGGLSSNAPEVRSRDTVGTNLKSKDIMINHENMKMFDVIISSYRDGNEEETLSALSTLISGEDKDIRDINLETLDSDELTASSHIVSKMNSLSTGIDPYVHMCVRHYEPTNRIFSLGNSPDTGGLPLIGRKSYNEMKDAGDEHITLGKIASMFIGYPMSTSGLYDEVQLVFYPVNTQAGGARKHTTASFPISMSRFKSELDKRLNNGEKVNNLSVHTIVGILENILSDSSIPAYGLYSNEGSSYTSIVNKISQMSSVEQAFKEIVMSDSDYVRDFIQEVSSPSEIPGIVSNYTKYVSEKESKLKSDKIRSMYQEEESELSLLYIKDKFVPCALSVFFETSCAIEGTGAKSRSDSFESVTRAFKEAIGSEVQSSSGILENKTILRIHIFDQATESYPDISLSKRTSIEGGIGGRSDNDNIENIQSLSSQFWKSYIRSHYPTIVQGSSNSVIKSIGVNSSTSGNISGIQMVESYEQKKLGNLDSSSSNMDDLVIFPSAVSVQMLGMPIISRGAQLFIDFGTGTTLDNIYTVINISHTISMGNFETNLSLVASDLLSAKSYKEKYLARIKEIRGA